MRIDLDKADLALYIKKAMNHLRQEVKADGYRQGKVPDNILKKELGAQPIKEEALNFAIHDSLAKAVQENDLEVMEYRNVNIKENTDLKLSFEVKAVLFPAVELGDYQSIEVKSKAISVSDDEVGATLDQVRNMRTVFKETSESIKEGDRVEVDFEVKDKGQVIEGGKSENHPTVIGKSNFVPGFEKELIGMKAGEEKSFSLDMPKDYYQKNLAGKNLDFHVKIKKVESPLPLEINDDFARSTGAFTDLNQLKENIKMGIVQEKQQKEAERVRLAVMDKILETSKIDVPAPLLEKQLDLIMTNFDKELHSKGMEMGLYLAHINKKQEELRDGFRFQAEKQVKTSLAIREIGKKEAIVVTEDEINERLTEINAAINVDEELMSQNMDVEELRFRVRQALFEEKVFSFLLGKINLS